MKDGMISTKRAISDGKVLNNNATPYKLSEANATNRKLKRKLEKAKRKSKKESI